MDGPVDPCLGVRAVRRGIPRATRCFSLLEQLLPVAAEEIVKVRRGFGLGMRLAAAGRHNNIRGRKILNFQARSASMLKGS